MNELFRRATCPRMAQAQHSGIDERGIPRPCQPLSLHLQSFGVDGGGCEGLGPRNVGEEDDAHGFILDAIPDNTGNIPVLNRGEMIVTDTVNLFHQFRDLPLDRKGSWILTLPIEQRGWNASCQSALLPGGVVRRSLPICYPQRRNTLEREELAQIAPVMDMPNLHLIGQIGDLHAQPLYHRIVTGPACIDDQGSRRQWKLIALPDGHFNHVLHIDQSFPGCQQPAAIMNPTEAFPAYGKAHAQSWRTRWTCKYTTFSPSGKSAGCVCSLCN